MTAPVVAVVGAGASGLGAGLALRDAGLQPVVLEAASHAGGKVATLREGGYLIERAALGLLDRGGVLGPLSQRLGLKAIPAGPGAQKRWVIRDGAVHALPSGPVSFVTTGLLSWTEKLRLFAEPWISPQPQPAQGETIRSFFARRLGPGGAFLADALQTGIYAGDADALDVGACFPLLTELEAQGGGLVRGMFKRGKALKEERKRTGAPRPPPARLSSFAGGLGELMGALAAQLGPAVRFGAQVRALHRDGARFRLSLQDAQGASELLADAVLLAIPAPEAAALLQALDPDLAGLLRQIRAAPVTQVHLGVQRKDVAGDVDGFGLLSPGAPILGTLLPASLWPGRAPEGRVLLSTLVGGVRHAEAAALPDEPLQALVRAHLQRTVRLRDGAQAELTKIVRWPQAVPQYELGHRARVQAIEGRLAALPGLRLTGAWYRGVSVLDCLKDGQAQAQALAARSDERAT